MRLSCLLCIWAGIVTAVSGQNASISINTITNQLDNTTVTALDLIVLSTFAQYGVAGGALSVVVPKQGRLLQTFGVSDVSTGAAFNVSDHFRIASITKTFTGTAVLQLIDSGNITSLNATLDSLLPSNISNASSITLQELLGMSSGIYDFTADATFGEQFEENPLLNFSFADVEAIVGRHEPYFPPGQTKMANYCDTNFWILAEIVEKYSGMSTGDYIEQKILQPLQMTGTSYPNSSSLPSPYSKGYYPSSANSSNISDYTAINPGVASGAGAMISTLRDLDIWSQALANGTLLSKSSFAARYNASLPLFSSSSLNISYNLGALTINDFRGHNGAIFGFNSFAFYSPSSGISLSFATNLGTNNGPLDISFGVKLLSIISPATVSLGNSTS